MLVSAKHKCPKCGETWKMPTNIRDEGEREDLEKGKRVLSAVCGRCQPRKAA